MPENRPVPETPIDETAKDGEAQGRTQPSHQWTGLPAAGVVSTAGKDDIPEEDMVEVIIRYRTLNGRTYRHDREDNQYWGPTDDRQSNTLDIGHHAYTLLMGGKLHFAPLPDKIDCVVDIGTGTGIWAMDFGDERPETEVIGTDISPIQPTWVPPNVIFQIEDFADEWSFEDNSVDYVHMRWLVGCIQDWTDIFKKAYRVMKPGAFIESIDFDANITSDDGTVTDKMALSQWGYIFQEGARRLGSRASFNPILEGLQRRGLEEAGFINITEKRYKVPFSEWPADPVLREIGQFTRLAVTNDIEGFITMMATQLGWSRAEITVYAAHLRREMRSLQVHSYFHGCVAYAQKPFS